MSKGKKLKFTAMYEKECNKFDLKMDFSNRSYLSVQDYTDKMNITIKGLMVEV
ncbi:MAG: hypothetical protein SVY15_01650 [Halobacteriota archaeon]|nr:hypothetical protein [Halobacteriota archaeon]